MNGVTVYDVRVFHWNQPIRYNNECYCDCLATEPHVLLVVWSKLMRSWLVVYFVVDHGFIECSSRKANRVDGSYESKT